MGESAIDERRSARLAEVTLYERFLTLAMTTEKLLVKIGTETES